MSDSGTSLDSFLGELEAEVEVGTAQPEESAPTIEGGQAEAEGSPTDDIFDVDQYSDKHVVVKVDGEEIKVPLKEALSGYQRQADYTRKTQELATARALQAALQNNPQATIDLLARTYGVEAAQQIADTVQQDAEEDWTANDPVAQRLAAFESKFSEFERYQQEQQLDQTLSGLQAKYGEDFNQEEVIVAAIERGVQSPVELEQVYRDLMFDKFYAQAKARDQFTAQQAAEDAAREAAKASLGQRVEQGGGVSASSAAAPTSSATSIADAWNLAKQELGLT
jgi:hypothetical protein